MFWNRKPHDSANKIAPLESIIPTSKIAEYRGRISIAPGVSYCIFAEDIDAKLRLALLNEHGSFSQYVPPTHYIVCTHILPKESNKSRLLFNLFFDLSGTKTSIQKAVIFYTCKDLADCLRNQQSRAWVIRCKSIKEYPDCVADSDIDLFWITEANILFKFYLNQFKQNASDQPPDSMD